MILVTHETWQVSLIIENLATCGSFYLFFYIIHFPIIYVFLIIREFHYLKNKKSTDAGPGPTLFAGLHSWENPKGWYQIHAFIPNCCEWLYKLLLIIRTILAYYSPRIFKTARSQKQGKLADNEIEGKISTGQALPKGAPPLENIFLKITTHR